MRFNAKITLLGSLLFSPYSFAVQNLGQVSQALMGPATGLIKAMYGMSYIIGAGFILGFLVQYKNHRDNPQQVRLSSVIAMLILGLVFLSLPWLTRHMFNIKVH